MVVVLVRSMCMVHNDICTAKCTKAFCLQAYATRMKHFPVRMLGHVRPWRVRQGGVLKVLRTWYEGYQLQAYATRMKHFPVRILGHHGGSTCAQHVHGT